ncbi:hypothetical protein ACFL56_02540 [Candidatus Margulisiibacteriota bacterium]
MPGIVEGNVPSIEPSQYGEGVHKNTDTDAVNFQNMLADNLKELDEVENNEVVREKTLNTALEYEGVDPAAARFIKDLFSMDPDMQQAADNIAKHIQIEE